MANRPLPRLQLFLSSQPLVRRQLRFSPVTQALASTARQASSTRQGPPISDKSRILAKPDKFRPPSHGRTRRKTLPVYGAPLSDHEREQQRTKQYPNMMPPEGSFLHWFIHNRGIHLWITLGTLTILASITLFHSFLHSTSYRSLLPSPSDFLHHPFSSTSKLIEVYKLHVAHESEKVAAKRQARLADVKKQEEFRRAHGVEPGFVQGGWLSRFGTVEQDQEKARLAKQQTGVEDVDRDVQGPVALATAFGQSGSGESQNGAERPQKRPVKKWLGIW